MLPADFIALVAPWARESFTASGVPASVTIAQAILESAWGESELATKARALFGVKYGTKWSEATSPYVDGSYSRESPEYLDGKWTTRVSLFCAYPDWRASVLDHGLFLRRPVYDAARGLPPDAYARAIHAAGYATDPGYSDKLIRLMGEHDLYRFDPQEKPMKPELVLLHSNAAGDAMILATSAAGKSRRAQLLAELNRSNMLPFGDVWTPYDRDVSELTKTKPVAVLLEVGQHDKTDYAQWLRDHIKDGSLADWLAARLRAVYGSTPLILAASKQPGNQYSGGGIGITDSEYWWMQRLAEQVGQRIPGTVVISGADHDGSDSLDFSDNVKAINAAYDAWTPPKTGDPLSAVTPRPTPNPNPEDPMMTPAQLESLLRATTVPRQGMAGTAWPEGQDQPVSVFDLLAWSDGMNGRTHKLLADLTAKLDALAALHAPVDLPEVEVGTVEPIDLDALADRIIARLAERMQS